MKKILFIIIVLCISFSGCKNTNVSESTDINVDEYSVAELSKLFCEQMANGNFDEISNNFSADLSAQLSKNQLRASWINVTSNIGNYKAINKTVENSENNIDIILEYEKSGLKVSLSYSEYNELIGIFLNYCDIEVDDNKSNIGEEKGITHVNVQIGMYKLNGVLTLPDNVNSPPLVIMVQGSGQSDYNENINGIKPFEDIADGLAKNGIATLRFNKRFYQHSELYNDDSTISEEVLDDVNEAINEMKVCDKVDGNKIIILGHSLGAMLAPKIVADNIEIKGFISMAGSSRKLEDIIVNQYENYYIQLGLVRNELNKEMKKVKDIANQIKLIGNDSNGSYFGISSAYWNSLNKIDYAELVSEIDIPVMIIQGANDNQIFADVDYEELKSIYADKNAKYILYDNLNHLFMDEKSEHVDKKVIDDISEWINTNFS